MFEDGMTYPVRGDWFGRTVIGGLLFIFSIFLIPIFFLVGYLIRVLERTVAGVDEPPAFDDWGDLFVKGIVGTVISVIYSVVPFVVFGILGSVLFGVVGLAGSAGGDGGGIVAGLGFTAILILGLLFVPVLFIVYYMVPAALTNYAIEDEFGAAFDFGTIKPILLSSEYLVATLLPLVVSVLLWIATSILGLTVIGLVLVPFLQFYGQVAVFRMFGSAFESVTRRSGTARASPAVSAD
jgi:hypothetical protein